VWLYPTWFSETSCITAMEAQAAGLIVVTSPIAALKETVGPRGYIVEGDWRSKEYADEIVKKTVLLAFKEGRGDHHADNFDGKRPSLSKRGELKRYANEHFGLDSLAADWDAMLLQIHADVTEQVVPAFREAAE
jgi:glycosyltransferase involved in cell wall biosynthesis